MKLNWQDNTAKVGGVEFVVFKEFDRSNIVVRINGLYDNYAPSSFDTEAEARLAAEAIVREIFKGVEVWRFIDPYDPFGNPSYSAFEPNDTTAQRGVFVPLEGE